jgi:hypothetical protein
MPQPFQSTVQADNKEKFMKHLSRRSFVAGALSSVAAPALIRTAHATFGVNYQCGLIYPYQQVVPQTAAAATISFPTNTNIVAPGIMNLMRSLNFDFTTLPPGQDEGAFGWLGSDHTGMTQWNAGGRLILSKTSGGDPYALAKGLSVTLGYGVGNDGTAANAALYQSRFGAVFGLCGSLSLWYQEAFRERGYPVRSVVTSDYIRNGYGDDGHVLAEVFINGQQRLFDAYGHYFVDNAGKHLSFYEVFLAGPANCNLVHLRQPPCPEATFFCEPNNILGSWSARAYNDQNMRTDAEYIAWVTRMIAVPGMQTSGGPVVMYMPAGAPPGLQAQLTALGFTFETQAQWLAQWYQVNGLNA